MGLLDAGYLRFYEGYISSLPTVLHTESANSFNFDYKNARSQNRTRDLSRPKNPVRSCGEEASVGREEDCSVRSPALAYGVPAPHAAPNDMGNMTAVNIEMSLTFKR